MSAPTTPTHSNSQQEEHNRLSIIYHASQRLEKWLRNDKKRKYIVDVVNTLMKNFNTLERLKIDAERASKLKEISAKLNAGSNLENEEDSRRILNAFLRKFTHAMAYNALQNVYQETSNLLCAITQNEGIEKEHVARLKDLIKTYDLNPNFIGTMVGENPGQTPPYLFGANLLGTLCWYGKVELVDWLLGYASKNLVNLDDAMEEMPPAILLAARSNAIPANVKINLIRRFPVELANPFLRDSNGEWWLVRLSDEIEPEVLQCLYEHAVAGGNRANARRFVTMHGTTQQVSLADDYIKTICAAATARRETDVVKVMIANGFFVEQAKNREWIQRAGLSDLDLKRRELAAEEGPDEKNWEAQLLVTLLPRELKNIVTQYIANAALFNSRNCFKHAFSLDPKWMQEEKWSKEGSAISKSRALLESAVRLNSELCELEDIESPDANTQRQIELLNQMIDLTNQLRQEPVADIAVSATTPTSRQAPRSIEEITEELDDLKRQYEALVKGQGPSPAAAGAGAAAAAASASSSSQH